MQASVVTILVSVGLLLFGLYKAWNLVRQILKKSQSESWQVTTAEVTSKQVVRKISARSGATYIPEIFYQYTVIGQVFENKIRLQKHYTTSSAEKKVDAIGATFGVRYNPDQPKEHLTEYDFINYADILIIVISLVFAGIMIYQYLS